MAAGQAGVAHYAILVGINAYSKKPLGGCVRDVQHIEQYLKQMHLSQGHSPVHVQTFTASEQPISSSPTHNPKSWPTYDNVALALKQIALSGKAGDFVYIHFSGHGTALGPGSAGEFSDPSTGDLALVLLEARPGTGDHYLRGQELAYLVKKMVDKGLIVTLVLDCCFSGSVVRDDSLTRFLRYDPEVDAAHPPIIDPNSIKAAGLQAYRSASMRDSWLVNPNDYTILTACGPTEIAKEIFVYEQKHGLLSYLLLEALRKLSHSRHKHGHIYPYLRSRFRETQKNTYIQNPMFYGNKNLGFFGRTSSGIDCVPIAIIQGTNGLRLEAGQAHGLSCGDELFVCSAKLDFTLEDGVTAKVTRVGALTSDLEISGAESSEKAYLYIKNGSTATLYTRLALQKYPVRLGPNLVQATQWRTALAERPSLIFYNSDCAEPEKPFFYYITKVDGTYYEIRDKFNQRIPGSTIIANDEGCATRVLDMIEHLTKFKMVNDLVNDSLADSSHPFRKSFDVEIIDPAGNKLQPGCLQQGWLSTSCSHPDCWIELEDGDKLELVVRNEGHQGSHDLYLHVYNMGPCYEIEDMLFGNHEVIPPAGSNIHEEFRQGTAGVWKKTITMTVSSGQQSNDIIKIFLTSQSTSFTSLECAKLGESLTRDRRSRSRGGGSPPPPEDWAAMNFRVLTRVKKYS